MKSMTVSVKQVRKKVRLVQEEYILLQRSNRPLMKHFGDRKTMMKTSTGKPVKIAATRFVLTAMCISRTIPRVCLNETAELEYFIELLR